MDIVITSIGMVSSVGEDVVTACASIRAGVTRPRPLPSVESMDEDTEKMAPVVGHPVRAMTEGFTIIGRWMRLAMGSVGDLLRYGRLPPPSDEGFWRKTGLLAVTPYHNDERFLNDESTPVAAVRTAYLEPLLGSLRLPIAAANADLVCLGQAGTVQALDLAARLLGTKGVERCIVLAVDSYCDPLTLEWLARHARLKTPDAPCGLQPGEAGACFLVESSGTARRRSARLQLAVEGVEVAFEEDHLFSENENRGVALSAALTRTLSVASPSEPFSGVLVSDLNGESWRASELGYARVRLARRLGDGLRVLCPAASLGDTGAASGAVSVCVAARALARGYSRSDRIVIAASSERGHVGSLSLRRGS